MGEDYTPLIPNISNFIIWGLKKFDELGICKSCIMSVGDIIRSVKNQFEQYAKTFLPTILDITVNQNYDKVLKLAAMTVISDALLFCSNYAMDYFPGIMQMLTYAIHASATPPNPNVKIHLYRKILTRLITIRSSGSRFWK